jgi:hypothetical protein
MSYVQNHPERISRLSFASGGPDVSSPSILDTWNQVPKQLKSKRRQQASLEDVHGLASPMYRRPLASDIDENQRKLDDMMLFNSQKQ